MTVAIANQFRTEEDALGEVRVPAEHLWGAETQGSHMNFPIGVERFRWGRHKNTRVWLGTVVDIDPDSKRVFLADGAPVPYDSFDRCRGFADILLWTQRVAGVGAWFEEH